MNNNKKKKKEKKIKQSPKTKKNIHFLNILN